jgi:hypothetical protein
MQEIRSNYLEQLDVPCVDRSPVPFTFIYSEVVRARVNRAHRTFFSWTALSSIARAFTEATRSEAAVPGACILMNRPTIQCNQGMGIPREMVLLLFLFSHQSTLLFRECEGVQTAKRQKVFFRNSPHLLVNLILLQL